MNNAETVRIKSELKGMPGCFGETDDIHIKTRLRQYAEREDPLNSRVNQFDKEFEGAAALWPDWGYGRSQEPNYTFRSGADRYTAELLKALAYRETQMNAAKADEHSVPTDIMQVNGGLNITEVMNGSRRQTRNTIGTIV